MPKESKRLKDARELSDFLHSQRKNWDEHAEELSRFICPRRGVFQGRDGQPNDGLKRHQDVLDSSATQALELFASGVQGGLTPEGRQWHRIGLWDKDLMEWGPVRVWLDAVAKVQRAAFSKSNFYQMTPEFYGELGLFGPGCMHLEKSYSRLLWYRCLTFGEFAWGCDERNRVNTVVATKWMPAKAMADRWGKERLSDATKKVLDKTPYNLVKVHNLVQPQKDHDPERLDAKGKPWKSEWYEAEGGEDLLDVSGYFEFPYMCTRFYELSGSPYAWSPGMNVLGDVKMLQEMAKTQIQELHMGLRPPMKVPTNYDKRLALIPGGYNEGPKEADSIKPLYQVSPNTAAVSQKITEVRDMIRDGFFNELFLMLRNRPDMTATEVLERQQEKMILLGPLLGRLTADFLNPNTERSFAILNRAGLMPPPPQEIEGMELRVEYLSPLAQSQKEVFLRSIQNFLATINQLLDLQLKAGQVPTALDKLDVDQVLDELEDITGVPAKLIRDDDQVEKLRTIRNEAQARQSQMQQGLALAQGAKSLAGVDMEGKNALTELLGAAGVAA